MKPPPTDTDPLPRRYPTLLPPTGITAGQFHHPLTPNLRGRPAARDRPWGLPLAARQLLVLTHLRTNLTPRPRPRCRHQPIGVLTASFITWSDSGRRTAARTRQARRPRIIDATLIPVHDQTITAPSKNYRRSVNTQILTSSRRRTVIALGDCWPANRNDVILARHPVAHLRTGGQVVLGDGGYRGITTITTPRRDHTGRIIRDQHWHLHQHIRARVEHVIARLKDWQLLHQCRRGNAINHSLQIVAGLWNLKTRTQLRVIS